jgi:hypothetical protein
MSGDITDSHAGRCRHHDFSRKGVAEARPASSHGAGNRAVSAKALFLLPPPALNLLFETAQASSRFRAAALRQPVAPGGAGLRHILGRSTSSRLACGDRLTAAVFRAREFPPVTSACTAPKPRPKPFGLAPASLRARRLRKAGSTQSGGKGMAAETNADTNTAGRRPAPQRLTQKQDESESNHHPIKGETP